MKRARIKILATFLLFIGLSQLTLSQKKEKREKRKKDKSNN